MRLNEITAWLIVLTVAGLLVYNVLAARNQRPGDTLGEVLATVVHDHPILTFLAGFVCGHLWWAQ